MTGVLGAGCKTAVDALAVSVFSNLGALFKVAGLGLEAVELIGTSAPSRGILGSGSSGCS